MPELSIDEFYKSLPAKKRNYSIASSSGTLNDWLSNFQKEDRLLRGELGIARARCQDLERNNVYIKAFINQLVTNVVGANGIKLNLRIKNDDGSIDKRANEIIEESWERWSKHGICTIDGNLSWVDVQKIALNRTAIDGDTFIMQHKSRDINQWGYGLQLIDGVYIDEKYNDTLQNGNRIIMGVEINSYGRKVAYHVLSGQRQSDFIGAYANDHIRVDADNVFHILRQHTYDQTRAAPWIVASAIELNHLGAYREYELVASRLEAAKHSVIESDYNAEYQGDIKYDGQKYEKMEAGVIQQLQPGQRIKLLDPAHPNKDFDQFNRAILKGAAAGMDSSYHAISRDLSDANFANARTGTLQDRDNYISVQNWYAGIFHSRVYSNWLKMSFLTGQVGGLPFSKFDKFNNPLWQGRRWGWVDPTKDMQAKKLELSMGITSPQRICRENGLDYFDIIDEIKEAQEYAKKAEVTLGEEKNEYEQRSQEDKKIQA